MNDLVERLLKPWDGSANCRKRRDEERDEAASRISQQDAELERVRRELAEAESERVRLWNENRDLRGSIAVEKAVADSVKMELAEAREAAFIEAAEIADGHAAEMRPKLAKYLKKDDEHSSAVYESAISEAVSIAAALRAKAEETGRG